METLDIFAHGGFMASWTEDDLTGFFSGQFTEHNHG